MNEAVPPMALAATLAALADEHGRMLALVQRGRVALLDGDAAAARALLDTLAAQLARHAEQEEREVLPRLGAGARWPAKVYAAEHGKLAQLAAALRTRLADVPAHIDDRVLRLALIDAHHPLQHLMEHHFAREEQGLFDECRMRDSEVPSARLRVDEGVQ